MALRYGNIEITKSDIRETITYILDKQIKKKCFIISTKEKISTYDVLKNSTSLTNSLYNDLKNKRYTPSIAREHSAIVHKKLRTFTKYNFVDTVFLHLLTKKFNSHMETRWPPNLFSYIKRRSHFDAAKKCVQYIKEHTDPLFFFEADIQRFYESIPTKKSSSLWSHLIEVFELSSEQNTYFISIIKKLICPLLQTQDGGVYQNIKGIPTGSPLSQFIANLYLYKMDYAVLMRFPNAFYARYCDDILFISPNSQEAEGFIEFIKKEYYRLELKLHPTKSGKGYLAPQNELSHQLPGIDVKNAINYLGYRIYHDGHIGLHSTFLSTLLKDVNRYIKQQHKTLKGLPFPQRHQELCKNINRYIDIHSDTCHPILKTFFTTLNDRKTFKYLDHHIAKRFAEITSNINGIKAFRQMPPKDIRHKHGLISLLNLKNRKM